MLIPGLGSGHHSEEAAIGLFGHGGDGGHRFVMREKLLSVGDDFWIEDDGGDKLYKVNGKALRARKTFVLEDPSGNEVAPIQDRVVAIRGKMEIGRGGESLATVHTRRSSESATGSTSTSSTATT